VGDCFLRALTPMGRRWPDRAEELQWLMDVAEVFDERRAHCDG
jgi:hypothetical protein